MTLTGARARAAAMLVMAVSLMSGTIAAQSVIEGAGVAASAPTGKPETARVVLATAEGRTQYHIGEAIPLTITLTSTVSATYRVEEDCRQEVAYRFTVIPDGFTSRKMELEAANAMYVGNCHGFAPVKDLQQAPEISSMTLNDWFRMEKSGTYTVTVAVSRLGFPVTSNSITIEILPRDAQWEEKQAALGEAALSAPQAQYADQEKAQCTILPYLDTEAAELTMAQEYTGNGRCDRNFYMPLVNAKARPQVLEVIKTGLSAPDKPITAEYLSLLDLLQTYTKHPEWFPSAAADTSISDKERGQRERMVLEAEVEIKGQNMQVLADVVTNKTAEAKAVSLRTLLETNLTNPGSGANVKFVVMAEKELPEVLSSLPNPLSVLVSDPELLKSSAAEPMLQSILGSSKDLTTRSMALRALNNIDPAATRNHILAALRDPQWAQSWHTDDLIILPDKDLPELDGILLQQLQRSVVRAPGASSGDAELLARYASPAIEPQVRALVEGKIGTMSEYPEAYLIAYFLRVDPPAGREMLLQEKRDPYGFIQRIMTLGWWPALGEAGMRMFDSGDGGEPINALTVLQWTMPHEGREKVLERFRQWSAQSKSLAAAIDESRRSNNPEGMAAGRIEEGYMQALLGPEQWVPTADEIAEVGAICLSQSCKDTAAKLEIAAREKRVEVTVLPNGFQPPDLRFMLQFQLQVEQTAKLKEKLKQYPKGTVVTLQPFMGGLIEMERLRDELQPWAKANGLTIEAQPLTFPRASQTPATAKTAAKN